jgi:hypothetical protein
MWMLRHLEDELSHGLGLGERKSGRIVRQCEI